MSDHDSSDEVTLLTPKVVEYCPHCSFPPEYCEFSSKWDQCEGYLKDKHPELYEKLAELRSARVSSTKNSKEKAPEAEGDQDGEDASGDQETEDKEKPATTQKPIQPIQQLKKKEIIFTVKSRTKRKHVTYVQGVEQFGFNAKELAKAFAKKFATAATLSDEGIQLQGDLCFDIADYLQQQNPELTTSAFILMKPGNIRSKLFPF